MEVEMLTFRVGGCSKRALQKFVEARKRHLKYLKRESEERYYALIKKLDLKDSINLIPPRAFLPAEAQHSLYWRCRWSPSWLGAAHVNAAADPDVLVASGFSCLETADVLWWGAACGVGQGAQEAAGAQEGGRGEGGSDCPVCSSAALGDGDHAHQASGSRATGCCCWDVAVDDVDDVGWYWEVLVDVDDGSDVLEEDDDGGPSVFGVPVAWLSSGLLS
eukprot:3084067-Rhodomonas_salina.2